MGLTASRASPTARTAGCAKVGVTLSFDCVIAKLDFNTPYCALSLKTACTSGGEMILAPVAKPYIKAVSQSRLINLGVPLVAVNIS